jgi:hypothetical protein
LAGWSGGGKRTSLGRGLKLSLRALLRGASGVRALGVECEGGAITRGGALSGGAVAAEVKTLATGWHQLPSPPRKVPLPATGPLLAVVMLEVVLTLRMPSEFVADRAALPGRGKLQAIPPAGVARTLDGPLRLV